MFSDNTSGKIKAILKPLAVWIAAGAVFELLGALIMAFLPLETLLKLAAGADLSLSSAGSDFDFSLKLLHALYGNELVLLRNAAALPFILRMTRRDAEVIRATLPVYSGHIERADFFFRKVPYRKMGLLFLLAAFCGISFSVFGNVLTNCIFSASVSESSAILSEKSGYGLMILILTECVIGPVTEEYLVRGVIYKRMRTYRGVLSASIISAVIFGVMHLDPAAFVYAFILGMITADLFETAGNPEICIAVHIAANVMSLLLLYMESVTLWLTGHTILILILSFMLLMGGVMLIQHRAAVLKEDKL